MTILDFSSGLYILTVTLQVDKEGERRFVVREISCKKGLAAIAGFEDEEGYKPRNMNRV